MNKPTNLRPMGLEEMRQVVEEAADMPFDSIPEEEHKPASTPTEPLKPGYVFAAATEVASDRTNYLVKQMPADWPQICDMITLNGADSAEATLEFGNRMKAIYDKNLPPGVSRIVVSTRFNHYYGLDSIQNHPTVGLVSLLHEPHAATVGIAITAMESSELESIPISDANTDIPESAHYTYRGVDITGLALMDGRYNILLKNQLVKTPFPHKICRYPLIKWRQLVARIYKHRNRVDALFISNLGYWMGDILAQAFKKKFNTSALRFGGHSKGTIALMLAMNTRLDLGIHWANNPQILECITKLKNKPRSTVPPELRPLLKCKYNPRSKTFPVYKVGDYFEFICPGGWSSFDAGIHLVSRTPTDKDVRYCTRKGNHTHCFYPSAMVHTRRVKAPEGK